jgi:hypothetical protein
MPGPRTLEGGLRGSGYLVAAGLAVQIGASWWQHPLSFIVFAAVACPLVVIGVLLFLWTIASSG